MPEDKVEYSCDQWIARRKSRCGRKPHCEVFLISKHSWSYLCRWHYYLDRIWSRLKRNRSHGYYILDPNAIEDRYQ